ncbi:MAG: energy transducer TonB [bacterium]
MQFQLNVTQKADQISIKDWTRAKEKNPGPTDQRRKILKQPLPEMPDWLEQAGEEVKVTVHFTIQPNGSVDEMEILSSSGYTELDDKVLRSVRNWKYESSTNPEDHVVQFQFKLQPGNEP